jgi:hypothetical protein
MTLENVIRVLRMTGRVLAEVTPVVLEAVIEAVRQLKRTSRKS